MMYGAPFGSKRFSFLFLTSLFNVLFFGLFSLSFLYYSPTPPKNSKSFLPILNPLFQFGKCRFPVPYHQKLLHAFHKRWVRGEGDDTKFFPFLVLFFSIHCWKSYGLYRLLDSSYRSPLLPPPPLLLVGSTLF